VLDGLERKLVAVVGDAVASRAHLDAVQLAGPGDEPTAGRGVVRIAVETVTADAGFDRDVIAIGGSPDAPVSRRVLPVRFTAAAHFALRPADSTPGQRTAARTLLLGDVSLVAHALAETTFQSGQSFATAGGDPGFEVKEFALAAGALDPDAVAGDDPAVLRATLRWNGRASVWPTTPPQPEGLVSKVDVELVPVPLSLSALAPVVRQGASTIVTIDGVAGRRTTAIEPPADTPVAVAVSVTSDLPPADRGHVEGGAAGVDASVRIVPVADVGTTVKYVAPTGSLGTTRVEFVAVHLATLDGDTGVFLDAIPIRLVPS
jgi:hypothetical protein